MGLGFPVFQEVFPKELSGHIKLGMPRYVLRYLLKRELLMVRVLFTVVLLVSLLLVPVMFGEEGQEGVPELLPVVSGVFQQFIQLNQVGYGKV